MKSTPAPSILLHGDRFAPQNLKLTKSLINLGLNVVTLNSREFQDRAARHTGIRIKNIEWQPIFLPAQSLPIINQLSKALNAYFLKRLLIRNNIDLIHVSYADLSAAIFSNIASSIPMVVTLWGSDVTEVQKPRTPRERSLLYSILDAAQFITADSPNLFEEARKIHPELPDRKFQLVYWGVDSIFFREPTLENQFTWRRQIGLTDNRPYILSPRRMKPLYRQIEILEAYSKSSCQESVDLVFKIASDSEYGSYFSELQNKVSELSLQHKIHFWGPCDHTDLPGPFNHAEFIVNYPESDGMPSTFFEAMATRTMILTNELEAYRGAMQDGYNCMTTRSNSIDHLSESMDRAWQNLPLRTMLSENAFNWVRENALWDRCLERFYSLYRACRGEDFTELDIIPGRIAQEIK